jgi:hypothetical protein
MDDFKTCFGQGMPGGMPPITDHCNHWDVTRDGLIDIVDYSWCRKCACK